MLDFAALLSPVEILTFFTACEHGGERVDRFLVSQMPYASRRRIQQHIETGEVTRGGRTVRRSNERVRPGEKIEVRFHKQGRELSSPDPSILPILHEDEHLIAVDKPAGLAAHPAGRQVGRTVLAVLYRRFQSIGVETASLNLWLPHRLDRETSGVMLLCKSHGAQERMSETFRGRGIKKEYVAVVHGRPDQASGHIDLPVIAADYRMMPGRPGIDPIASTSWRVSARGRRRSLLVLSPTTGRRHQLRVQLAAIGHPIVGDSLYGLCLDDAGSAPSAGGRNPARMALHATYLRFHHPITGEVLELRSPVPAAPIFCDLEG